MAMNKGDLIKILSKEYRFSLKKAEDIVHRLFQTLTRTLVLGERVEIRGFGSFTVRNYKGYTGRNPATGERTVVESKKLPFFKAGKELAEGVNREAALAGRQTSSMTGRRQRQSSR
jgi:integration host factor subunit beta